MSDILNYFDICSNLSEDLKNRIIRFHVYFDDSDEKNILFVTSDDKVYTIGPKSDCQCSSCPAINAKKLREITELRYKLIKQFVIGKYFIIALSNEAKKVYGWGHSEYGQLGKRLDQCRLKPVEIKYFNGKEIMQLSSGYNHTLALVSNGHVYGWGSNDKGQTGRGVEFENMVFTIGRIVKLPDSNIASIYAAKNSSFAITSGGHVYAWGENNNFELNHIVPYVSYFQPILLDNISNVVNIGSSDCKTYFLTGDGTVWVCRLINGKAKRVHILSQIVPKVLLTMVKIPNTLLSSIVDDTILYELRDNALVETDCEDVDEYYARLYQVTKDTIEISHAQSLEKDKTYANKAIKMMTMAFNNKDFHDLKFKLKKKTSEDQFELIYVHKWFITFNSEYFRGMFANDWSECQSNEIEINGYSYEAYYQYVRWLYVNSIDVNEIDVLMEVLSLSDEYLDTELKKLCEESIKILAKVSNISEIYTLSVRLNVKELEKFCFTIIKSNIKQVVETESFKNLEDNLAKDLLVKFVKQL